MFGRSVEDLSSYFHSDQELNVDVFDLFNFYNQYFFHGRLDKCVVKWSKRMTLCAGTCKYEGLGSSTITLSEALLQYRSSDEVKETLLHEMIHAYLFITDPESCKHEGGHGPPFQKIMREINRVTGLNLTVYHSFHDEVELHRKHVWRCTGKCKDKPPYFGYVRRAMNREPQKADHWFAGHQKSCGGTFVKIMSPDQDKKQSKKQPKKPRKSKEKKEDPKSYGGMTIADYVKLYEKEEAQNSKQTQASSDPQIKEVKKPAANKAVPVGSQPSEPPRGPHLDEPFVDYELLALLDSFADDI